MTRQIVNVTEHAILRWQQRVANDKPLVAAEHITRIASEGVIHRQLGEHLAGEGVYWATHEAWPDVVVVLHHSDGRRAFRAVTVLPLSLAFLDGSRP